MHKIDILAKRTKGVVTYRAVCDCLWKSPSSKDQATVERYGASHQAEFDTSQAILKREQYPVTMTAHGPDDEVVWTLTIQAPKSPEKMFAVPIPETGHGSVTKIITEYGNGETFVFEDPTAAGTL